MGNDFFDKIVSQEFNKETEKIRMSIDLRNKIKAEAIGRPRTSIDILKAFLNRRIEIPIVPVVMAAVIIGVVIFLPFNRLKAVHEYGKLEISSQYTAVNVGNASIIINRASKGDELHVNY